MSELLVIQEGADVIGVADSMDNVDKMLWEYYGGFIELLHEDVQDNGIECIKHIEADGEKSTVTVFNFRLNEI